MPERIDTAAAREQISRWQMAANRAVRNTADDALDALDAAYAEIDAAEDFRTEIAVEAFTAPDESWDVILDSLRARFASLHRALAITGTAPVCGNPNPCERAELAEAERDALRAEVDALTLSSEWDSTDLATLYGLGELCAADRDALRAEVARLTRRVEELECL